MLCLASVVSPMRDRNADTKPIIQCKVNEGSSIMFKLYSALAAVSRKHQTLYHGKKAVSECPKTSSDSGHLPCSPHHEMCPAPRAIHASSSVRHAFWGGDPSDNASALDANTHAGEDISRGFT